LLIRARSFSTASALASGPREVEAVFDQVAAGAFDDPGGDRPAGGQWWSTGRAEVLSHAWCMAAGQQKPVVVGRDQILPGDHAVERRVGGHRAVEGLGFGGRA
jgi:hypothetical protein